MTLKKGRRVYVETEYFNVFLVNFFLHRKSSDRVFVRNLAFSIDVGT